MISKYHKPNVRDLFLTRRGFLNHCGMGLGMLSLASLFSPAGMFARAAAEGMAAPNPLTPKDPPLPAKAKRVLHIFANGGPSHVDTFDPKPSLARLHGKQLPMANLPTERKTGAAFQSPFKFTKYGESGIEVS